jgi:hypothetical protein
MSVKLTRDERADARGAGRSLRSRSARCAACTLRGTPASGRYVRYFTVTVKQSLSRMEPSFPSRRHCTSKRTPSTKGAAREISKCSAPAPPFDVVSACRFGGGSVSQVAPVQTPSGLRSTRRRTVNVVFGAA